MAMVLGVVGALVSGVAAMSQARYQAAIAKANAEQERVNARTASDQAGKNIEDLGSQFAGQKQELATIGATSGFAGTSPSLARGADRFADLAIIDQTREFEKGQIGYAQAMTRANIEDTRAAGFKSQAMFAGLSMVGNVIKAGLNGSSMVGGASSVGPGYIPIPRQRPTYYPGAIA